MAEVIIHGASGFLGKHLARKFISKGISLILIARSTSNVEEFENKKNVTIIRTDHSSEFKNLAIEASNPIFFDLAWYGVFGSDRNDPKQFDLNIPMTLHSLMLAKRLNSKHWIGLGSQAEYGLSDKKIKESDPCNPQTFYGKSKLICSQISSEFCQALNMDHSWLRLFSVYGPEDNHQWLIQYLIKEMISGNEIKATKGEQVWDYLYIDDVTDALFKLAVARGVGIANLSSGKETRIMDLMLKMKSLTNSASPIKFGALPYRSDQVMYMCGDNSKLSKHIDWFPCVDLESGLSRTINGFKQ